MVFSGNLWSCLKDVKPLVMFDGECRMALEPMQGNWASSLVDLGYTEQFRVAAVTSGCHQTSESVLQDFLEFHHASQGSLSVSWGTRKCSARNAGELDLNARRGGSFMVFLELWLEPVLYS